MIRPTLAYAIIAGQKQWMLALFTDLAGDITPDGAGQQLGLDAHAAS